MSYGNLYGYCNFGGGGTPGLSSPTRRMNPFERDVEDAVPCKKNDPLGEGGTVRPYKERHILYKNAENVGRAGVFDVLRRTFVHLAQKNLQIRSDILPENPRFRLDFAEQMCYNMQRKDGQIYKKPTPTRLAQGKK